MPLIQTIQDGGDAKIGIWLISEPEAFFVRGLPPAIAEVPGVLHPRRRLQHLAARYLLTQLRPDFPLEAVRISSTGKPVLPANSFHFSLAHSADRAAAIVSRSQAVGIDVEQVKSKITHLGPKFLNPSELAFQDQSRLAESLTVCWNAKEAVYKWCGQGGVSFRDDMHLQPFALSACGRVCCEFRAAGRPVSLSLPYILDDGFGLAWLSHEPA